MHEMTVAASLIEALLEAAEREHATAIERAHVRIGALSCIQEEALRFGFEALSRDTLAEGCELQVIHVPARGECDGCGWTGEVTDPIQVIETGEKANSFDGGVNVKFEPWAGVHVSPSAGASRVSKKKSEYKYSKLPAKRLLVASGTTRREHGVFFKMKPSTQDSLEGRKEFVCRFVVPKGWRGDYVYVDCTATSQDRTPWSSPDDCGSRRVFVGLYLQGDAEAKEAAERPAYALESYVAAGGRVPGSRGSGQEAVRLLRRFPGSSLVESVIDDLAIDKGKTARKKDEAWESFQSAVEELSRFTG